MDRYGSEYRQLLAEMAMLSDCLLYCVVVFNLLQIKLKFSNVILTFCSFVNSYFRTLEGEIWCRYPQYYDSIEKVNRYIS